MGALGHAGTGLCLFPGDVGWWVPLARLNAVPGIGIGVKGGWASSHAQLQDPVDEVQSGAVAGVYTF